jgi:hypothetical protein
MTGGAAHNRYVEAEIMAETAKAQEVPATAILEESQAQIRFRTHITPFKS